jgi:hypothetical protein
MLRRSAPLHNLTFQVRPAFCSVVDSVLLNKFVQTNAAVLICERRRPAEAQLGNLWAALGIGRKIQSNWTTFYCPLCALCIKRRSAGLIAHLLCAHWASYISLSLISLSGGDDCTLDAIDCIRKCLELSLSINVAAAHRDATWLMQVAWHTCANSVCIAYFIISRVAYLQRIIILHFALVLLHFNAWNILNYCSF